MVECYEHKSVKQTYAVEPQVLSDNLRSGSPVEPNVDPDPSRNEIPYLYEPVPEDEPVIQRGG